MIKQIFHKKTAFLLLLFLIGIALIAFSDIFSDSKQKESETSNIEVYELCEERCEEKISILLEQIYGIRKASVLITLDTIPSNKERPHVRGVAIVCNGDETPELCLKIVMLVSSALGITSDKIYVTFT